MPLEDRERGQALFKQGYNINTVQKIHLSDYQDWCLHAQGQLNPDVMHEVMLRCLIQVKSKQA